MGEHESVGGALHEEEAVRMGDEDKCLRDDGHLEVYDRVKLEVVGVNRRARRILEGNTELVLEESRLHDDDNEDDT